MTRLAVRPLQPRRIVDNPPILALAKSLRVTNCTRNTGQGCPEPPDRRWGDFPRFSACRPSRLPLADILECLPSSAV